MVVHRVRERHEQGGSTHSRNFSHSRGASAANDHVCLGKGLGGVLNKGREFGVYTGGQIAGAQRVNVASAALVQHLRALSLRQQGQSLGHQRVERLGAQAAAHHQQFERATAARKTLGRRRLRHKGRAQRVAHPLGLGEHFGKGREDAVGQGRQHPVGQTRHRVLLVQHQGLAQQHTHHAARKADVATQAQHHLGLHAAHHLQTLPKRLQEAQRQQGQCDRAFAAQATKGNGIKSNASFGHQLALHAGLAGPTLATQPMHAPAALLQGLTHCQTRENMATCAAGHDQGARRLRTAHTRPPVWMMRFS